MAAGAKIGSLFVNTTIQTAAFMQGLSEMQKKLKGTQKTFADVGTKIRNIGLGITAGLTLPLAAAAKAAVDGAMAQRQAMAQVEAALKSMGDASGRTSEQLLKASDALEMNSLVDGDVILKQITANLLTFGKVSGEVFDRAQQAAVDMATRLGGEPQAAAIMLGKALNDPLKGITALTRVGVSFTEQQKAQIKAMAESGQIAKAQGIILDEVGRQFGGAAKAAADTDPWRKVSVAMAQVGDNIGEKLIPFIEKLASFAGVLLDKFNRLTPVQQDWVLGLTAAAAVLGPIVTILGPMVMAVGKLLP